jgi:hypothetical protein
MTPEDFAATVRKVASTLKNPDEARWCRLEDFDGWDVHDHPEIPSIRICLRLEADRLLNGEIPIMHNGELTGYRMAEDSRVLDFYSRVVKTECRHKGLVTVRLKVRNKPRQWRYMSVSRLEKEYFPLRFL